MRLREARFVDSVVNGGSDEVMRLQSYDSRDGRHYAGDLRMEGGFIRWGARFAPLSNVRVFVEEPPPVVVEEQALTPERDALDTVREKGFTMFHQEPTKREPAPKAKKR